MKNPAGRRVLYILLMMLLLVLIIVIVAAITVQNKTGSLFPETKQTESLEDTQKQETSNNQDGEKWQEGIIQYNNKKYKYNNQLKVYLLMGVDTETTVIESMNHPEGAGQSDAMFLLVTNPKTMEMSVISINRNTMTQIEAFSENGGSLGYYDMQLCLQFAYGDGAHLSCARTVEAVSNLFYNLPIHGYLSINMGAVPKMNDGVGGVEVEVLETLEGDGFTLKEGETVLLKGEQAFVYLRGRDLNKFDSSTSRLRRQEQYIGNYLKKLKQLSEKDAQSVAGLYESISDYTVTNLNLADAFAEFSNYEFDEAGMYTVPGETRQGETFEEYYVDSEAFYKIILDVFYEEVVS